MDSQGKPEMSRELLERLMRNQSVDVSLPASAPSSVSFDQRRKLEHRRQLVRGYRDSKLGSGSVDTRKIRQVGMEVGYARRPNFEHPKTDESKPVDTGQNRPSAGFKEPPARDYNPFS